MIKFSIANDDMKSLLTLANKNQTVIAPAPEIRFQGKELDVKPASDKFWLRVEINTLAGGQDGFKQNVKVNGQRMYKRAGLVRAQLFLPKSQNNAWGVGSLWAEEILKAFLKGKTANGVWFRNANIVEMPIEAEFYRINVVSEFEYSEIY